MTDRAAIHVDGVSKAFLIPHERRTRLKESFAHPLRRTTYERNQALERVTFDVARGEFFGIIGPNGSGKSTLLKILAHIYRADAGTVRVNGRLSPFIELGVGFNYELTARENIEINGVLLGLTRAEVARAFRRDPRVCRARAVRRPAAEELLERDASPPGVLDRDPGPVRHPAAGRGARGRRRALSGEVLRDRSRRSRGNGKTVVFVSHDLGAISRFCDRALCLSEGRVQEVGPAVEVVDMYRDQVALGDFVRPFVTRTGMPTVAEAVRDPS